MPSTRHAPRGNSQWFVFRDRLARVREPATGTPFTFSRKVPCSLVSDGTQHSWQTRTKRGRKNPHSLLKRSRCTEVFTCDNPSRPWKRQRLLPLRPSRIGFRSYILLSREITSSSILTGRRNTSAQDDDDTEDIHRKRVTLPAIACPFLGKRLRPSWEHLSKPFSI